MSSTSRTKIDWRRATETVKPAPVHLESSSEGTWPAKTGERVEGQKHTFLPMTGVKRCREKKTPDIIK
jgi:hypothetical protein